MYAYNTAAQNTTAGANTVTVSPPTGSLIIIYSVTSPGGGTPTVTFSDNAGSTWANASNNVNVGGNHYSVGYCLAAAAGVTLITATYNGGTPGTCDLVAAVYTGMSSPSFVAVAAPNSQTAPGAGANAITTNALNCGATTALFVGLTIEFANHANITAGAGYTLRFNVAPGAADGAAIIDPNAEVTGLNTATFTSTNGATDQYGSIAIAFADVTGVLTPNKGAATLSGNTAGLIQGNIITPATAKIRDAVRSFFLPRYRGLVRG